MRLRARNVRSYMETSWFAKMNEELNTLFPDLWLFFSDPTKLGPITGNEQTNVSVGGSWELASGLSTIGRIPSPDGNAAQEYMKQSGSLRTMFEWGTYSSPKNGHVAFRRIH